MLFPVFLCGCVTVDVPNYIKDNKPYKESFYTGFDEALNAVTQTIEKFGWIISGTSDPSVFERRAALAGQDLRQMLLFTDIRETKFFLGTRYARMNIYVREKEKNTVDVEIRYVTITSLPFKSFSDYKHDATVARIMKQIRLALNQS